MEALVSVVIPVYNVEQYLSRCVDSVLGQTYKNLEIFLIDDGSIDNSGALCDMYSVKDNRVTVIHKKNGGLSSARNAGLREAGGEYIAFVDSDDWIDEDFIEALVKDIEKEQADLAMIGYRYVYDDCTKHPSYPIVSNMLSQEEAIEELCKNKWLVSYAWNKLYKRSLFDGICYPEGQTYEDIYIMHTIFQKCSRIACNKNEKYNYYMRSNSIVHNLSIANHLAIFKAYEKRYCDLKYRNRKKDDKNNLKCCAMAAYNILYGCNKKKEMNEDNKKQIQQVEEFWTSHKEIASLGLKYIIMYRFPALFKLLSGYKDITKTGDKREV